MWTPPVSPWSKELRISTSRGFVTSSITIPFLRLDAPSRLRMQSVPSSETFTSFTVLASTCTVSMSSMFRGSVTS